MVWGKFQRQKRTDCDPHASGRRQSNEANLRFITNIRCRPFLCPVFFLLALRLSFPLSILSEGLPALLSITRCNARFVSPLGKAESSKWLLAYSRSLEEMLVTKASLRAVRAYHSGLTSDMVRIYFVEEDPLRLGIQTAGGMETNDLHKNE